MSGDGRLSRKIHVELSYTLKGVDYYRCRHPEDAQEPKDIDGSVLAKIVQGESGGSFDADRKSVV